MGCKMQGGKNRVIVVQKFKSDCKAVLGLVENVQNVGISIQSYKGATEKKD